MVLAEMLHETKNKHDAAICTNNKCINHKTDSCNYYDAIAKCLLNASRGNNSAK